MKLNFSLLCVALIIFSFIPVAAQNQYNLPACASSSESQKFVGGRLKLFLPKNAILKKGQDIDYSNYFIGFGEKKNRVWLSGIFGPTATSGKVPEKQLSASTDLVQRSWKFGEFEGVDTKGKLANGNVWRYIGQYGEAIEYYDVPKEAADYFDGILDNVCYQEWKK